MQGLKTEFLLDPRINPAEPVYQITRGGSKITYQFYPSQAYSESSLQFQVVPLSPNTFLDRKVLVTHKTLHVLTAANPLEYVFPVGSNPADLGIVSLRYMCMNNICSNFQVNINGNSWSYRGEEIFAPMSQYNTPSEPLESLFWSVGPSCKEPGQTFDQTFGTPRSSMASRFQNTVQDSNAVNSQIELVSNVPGQAIIRCTTTEYILYPVFISGIIEREALVGLTSPIVLTWSFPGLSRFLQYDEVNGTQLASISSNWDGAPILRTIWITAPSSMAIGSANGLAFKYPYTNITPYFTPPTTLAAGVSARLSANNIQFSGVPHCAYIFARQILQDRTPFDADSYARIDKVNIIFDNLSGILAGASAEQLYAICVQNGLQTRYADWRNGVGSVLKLQFDKDIPISPELSVGVSKTLQFAVELDVTNINPNPINYGIIVIVCYEGVMTIYDSTATTNINVVSEVDVLIDSKMSDATSLDIAEQSAIGLYNGGSIMNTASNYIKRGVKFYKNNKQTIDNILTVGKTVGLVAADLLIPLLGAGLSYEQARDMLIEHGYSNHHGRGLVGGGGPSGGGLVGGKLITNQMDLISGKNTIHDLKKPLSYQNRPRLNRLR